MPIVTFSVPQDIYEKIQSNASTNESENLAAKRLLLGVLGVESPGAISSDFGDRLEKIEDQLEQLEKASVLEPEDLERLAGILARDYWGDGQGQDRLETIESRLDKFETHLDWAKREILDQREKIKSIESDAYWYEGKKPETTIMIQKQPLPLAVEIQRTHEEAAKDWGKTLATVKRWAKDPDKWPEGWLWDGDKKFWVKEV